MASEKLTPYHREYYKKKRHDKNKIRFRTSFRNVVYDALKCRGWKEVGPNADSYKDQELDWDIIWADREWIREVFDTIHLESHQKVNHFRNHYELTRKDSMARNIKRHKRTLSRNGKTAEAEKYNFIPMTFTLPHEYAIFVEEFKKNPTNSQWIMKPVGKCQGRGIFLFTKLSDISDWKNVPKSYYYGSRNDEDKDDKIESYVVQKYIRQPFLIGNKKFDLRIYVLVTCYSPLIVYIYRSGFARFTNSRYSNSPSQIDNAHMHLTNAAVQKTNDEYNKNNDLKWNIRSLKLYLITKYGEDRINILFKEIQDVIIKSLICVSNVIINDKHCFELYGYDIMIDNDLKVWLIEANAAPSFTASSDHDYLLKFSVINDCLDIVMTQQLQHNQEKEQLQFGGFDLIYKGGAVQYHDRCLITSYLGCQNPSLQKYKKIIQRVKKMKKQKKKD